MADLVRAQPALKVEFVPSLGLDVLSTMGLLCLVHDFEGLHEWLVETAAGLPARLRHDMQLVLRMGFYPYVAVEALYSVVGVQLVAYDQEEIDGMLEDLRSLSLAECQAITEHMLARAMHRSAIEADQTPTNIIADQESLEAVIKQLNLPIDHQEAVSLYQDPQEWRNLLVSTIQRFWDRCYAHEYHQQHQQRERNIHYHRAHPYSAHFTDLFAAVTGRILPDEITQEMDEIELVQFVPSLYIGPYLAFLVNAPQLTVFYNSRVTPTEGDEQAERTQSLYQPLAALADKTRLQIMSLLRGRELYAQEIVNLLDIHQSAVSRHLKLMETSGVLIVRRDKGAKYYSINRQRLEEISVHLRDII